MNIDPGSFMVYGVPWMIVGAVILWLIAKYFQVPSEGKLFFTALWAVLGFVFTGNLQAIEMVWPAMPDVLPQIFTAILIFGAIMGFQPGPTADRVVKAFQKRVQGRSGL